jgi:hypothetical protein
MLHERKVCNRARMSKQFPVYRFPLSGDILYVYMWSILHYTKGMVTINSLWVLFTGAGVKWRFTANQFVLAPNPLRLTARIWSKSKSKICYDRRSEGQSVLVSSTHLGLTTRFLLLSDNCWFVDVGRSLRRENGSAVYTCCWSSPVQSFLGPSPAGPVTIFYCLRFEAPPTWRARSPYFYPPGTGWPSYAPRAPGLLII